MKANVKILEERQKWSLQQKIDHSLGVIDQFINHTNKNCYVSFSGGKDSTVLLDLCRIIYPEILAVFCNTGTEFPDIVYFINNKIKAGENIKIIRPKMTPREVWEKYGFPLVSKETAHKIHQVRFNPTSKTSQMCLGNGYFCIPQKWRYLINEPYETNSICCNKLKKEPFHRFEKETGLSPIIGVMAEESILRRGQWIRNGGCNVFNGVEGGVSRPLSIWTENDIWRYIKQRNLHIAEIYQKGARRTGCVGCGFGAQFPDDDRFKILLNTYPRLYGMIMAYTNNGISYREALRKVLSVNKLFLPDEELQMSLFD